MTFTDSYRKTAAGIFQNYVEKHVDKFRRIHQDLRMSNMGVMLREYVSVCFFNATIAAIISFPVAFILLLLLGFGLLPTILFVVIMTALATVGVFVISLEYPAMKVAERRKNIDNNLPFATLYMNTIAGTGAPPDLIFRILSDFKEYGEVSREAQAIVEDIDVLGQDIEVALSRAAENSPSSNFKDLLWGMVTTIVRGGDLRSLLKEQSEYLMAQYRRNIEQYAADLSLYVEIYITMVIVGSIFSLVMMTIMGAISGFAELRTMQQLIVFVFLPMASIFFMVLLKLTSPISS